MEGNTGHQILLLLSISKRCIQQYSQIDQINNQAETSNSYFPLSPPPQFNCSNRLIGSVSFTRIRINI